MFGVVERGGFAKAWISGDVPLPAQQHVASIV